MPGFDPAAGTLVLPVWAAGAVAALFFIVCILALSRAGFVRAFAAVAVVLLGGLTVWSLLERSAMRDRLALDARAGELTARALVPGSPLACLDAMAGDTVETACEKAGFASP